jgi:hypothetical protein
MKDMRFCRYCGEVAEIPTHYTKRFRCSPENMADCSSFRDAANGLVSWPLCEFCNKTMWYTDRIMEEIEKEKV